MSEHEWLCVDGGGGAIDELFSLVCALESASFYWCRNCKKSFTHFYDKESMGAAMTKAKIAEHCRGRTAK